MYLLVSFLFINIYGKISMVQIYISIDLHVD